MFEANPTAQSEALDVQAHTRRKDDEQIVALTAILASVNSLHKEIKKLDDIQLEQVNLKHTVENVQLQVHNHVEKEETLWDKAFVAGDIEGHRRLHEAMVRREEDKAEVWMAAKKKMIDMSLWGIVMGFGIVLLFYWNGHVPTRLPL